MKFGVFDCFFYEKFISLLILLLSLNVVFVSTHLISTASVIADVESMGVQPEDTIFLEAGLKPYLLLKNFHGSEEQYLTFINHNGRVEISNDDFFYGLVTFNCSYFRLTGTGDPDHFYGIKITASNGESNGLSLDAFSTNFEIDHLEIYNTGFAGIMSKTNPTCDTLTQRSNFTQHNTIFYDNFIHKTGGEGLYLGHSYYAGYEKICDGDTAVLFPHEIYTLKVYNNIIDSTGYDGIQIGFAVEGCEVYGNTITNAGFADDALGMFYRMSGIVLGGGTSGWCYNNLIYGGYASGISIFGLGDLWVYNNVIVDAGRKSKLVTGPPDNFQAYGIFCDDRTTIAGKSFNLINNTILNPRDIGIRFWSLESANNRMFNNLIINPGVKQWDFSRSMIDVLDPELAMADTLSGGNYFDSTAYDSETNPYFINQEELNFHLKPDAPNIDSGFVFDSLMFLNFDFDDRTRPLGKSTDPGAFEFTSLPDSISISFIDSVFCEGTNFTLEIDSVFSATSFVYQWYFNDSAIEGQNLSYFQIDTLEITNAGAYKVSISNEFVEIFSNKINIDISPKPFALIGTDTTICLNYAGLLIKAQAKNHEGLVWLTNGDGRFETENSLRNFYHPGEEDKINGSVQLSLTVYGDEFCDSISSALTLTFDACTGLEDIPSNTKIYPNPTNDYLFVNSDNDPILGLKFSDILGNLLMDQYPNSFFEKIDLKRFNPGIYILQLVFRDRIESMKIIRK